MIITVVGTRPEIIKMASVIEACRKLDVDYSLAYAKQHYDWNMSAQFMKDLGYPKPDYVVDVGSGTHSSQTSAAMMGLEKLVARTRPDAVVVEGDTNTVLASALASVKLHVPVCHVEAGLRSYDLRMPEEHNRRLVDHVSSLLFAPTSHAASVLRNEKVWGRIRVSGNTVIDACLRFMDQALAESEILGRVRFRVFALATLHRSENVDNLSTLRTLVGVLLGCPIPVVFPVHPRTMIALRNTGLMRKLEVSKKIQLLPPIGYFDLLVLMKECEFILTDSGGIQEEATSPNIRKFVFVLRERTERPEGVRAGFAKVVGTRDCGSILRSLELSLKACRTLRRECPYGDGNAGFEIAKALRSHQFKLKRHVI